LGYFEVSAVSQKRKYITFSELSKLNLPYYQYDCVRIDKAPSDYCIGVSYCVPPTMDQMYQMWITAKYVLVEPIYNSAGGIERLVFTTPECADCENTGTFTKPSFWVDLN